MQSLAQPVPLPSSLLPPRRWSGGDALYAIACNIRMLAVPSKPPPSKQYLNQLRLHKAAPAPIQVAVSSGTVPWPDLVVQARLSPPIPHRCSPLPSPHFAAASQAGPAVSALYVIALLLSAPIYLVYYLLDKFIFPIFLYAFEAIARTPCLNATAHSEVLPGDGCAFITGADSGIGKEIALDLANRGFDLVITSHNEEHGEEVQREIAAKYPQIKVIRQDACILCVAWRRISVTLNCVLPGEVLCGRPGCARRGNTRLRGDLPVAAGLVPGRLDPGQRRRRWLLRRLCERADEEAADDGAAQQQHPGARLYA